MRRGDIWRIALLGLLGSGHALAQEFHPAQIGDHEQSVLNRLVVPFGRPAGQYDVSVTCQVIVEQDGSPTRPHCLADERYETFRQEVLAAISGTVMRPATIDGTPVRVLLSFMAGFHCLDVCSILLLDNHARHSDELGFFYTAPQPVLEDGSWYHGFDDKLAWTGTGMRADESGGVKFIVSTNVDTLGRSVRRRVVQRSPGYWRAATRAASSLDDVRYIPAFQEGQPIELRLYEYWLDPNGAIPATIALPVRVHMASSAFVEALDTTMNRADIERFVEEVNEHWRSAGIRWDIESVVEVDAERQLAFRRIVEEIEASEDIDFSQEAYDVFSQLCPREEWLTGAWNVCFIGRFPWASTHFGEGFVVVGELDARTEPVQPFALARELGETLGMENTPYCTSRFLVEDDETEGAATRPCATTDISGEQVAITRHQAAKGEPACPRRLRYGDAGGNWALCAWRDRSTTIGARPAGVAGPEQNRPPPPVFVAPAPSAPAE